MDRIIHSSAVDIGGGRRGFRSKDTVAGVPGTVVTAGHMNAQQEEIMAVIEKAGFAPSALDLAQLLRAIRSQGLNWRAAGGTANALTIALDPPPANYDDLANHGTPIRITPLLTNTGPATLNVNGLGPVSITGPGASALRPGDLPAYIPRELIHNGSAFILTSPVAPAPSNFQVYAVAGTYTFVVPAGIYTLLVEAIGGGGGGGGATSSSGQTAGASGGGGAGYVEGVMSVLPGQSITIVVGAGGLAGTAIPPVNGGNGGSTTVGGAFTATPGTGGVSVNNSYATGGGNGGGGFGGPSQNGIGGSPPAVVANAPLGGQGGGARYGSISFFGAVLGQGPAGIGPGGGGSGAAAANGSTSVGGPGQPGYVKLSW